MYIWNYHAVEIYTSDNLYVAGNPTIRDPNDSGLGINDDSGLW
jgi:hypothetical protein